MKYTLIIIAAVAVLGVGGFLVWRGQTSRPSVANTTVNTATRTNTNTAVVNTNTASGFDTNDYLDAALDDLGQVEQ